MRKLLGGIVVLVALTLAAGSAPLASAQSKPKDPATQKDKKDKSPDTRKAAAGLVVEIYKDAGGEFRFRIKEGDAILASCPKGYDTKAACMKVVNNLKDHMAKAKVEDHSSEPSK